MSTRSTGSYGTTYADNPGLIAEVKIAFIYDSSPANKKRFRKRISKGVFKACGNASTQFKNRRVEIAVATVNTIWERMEEEERGET